ncbi:MAG: hypothetical protein ACK4OJ_12000 [Brevundimonas sp.]
MSRRASTVGCSAETAARALVAACLLLGVDPAEAYGRGRGGKGKTKDQGRHGGYGARVLAAHGVRARLGVAPVVLARMFSIDKTNLAPSQAHRRGITSDQLLVIAEAISGASVASAPEAAQRLISPREVPARPALPRAPSPEPRAPRWLS